MRILIIFVVIVTLVFGVINYISITPSISSSTDVSVSKKQLLNKGTKIQEQLPDYDLREREVNNVITKNFDEGSSGENFDEMLEKSEATLEGLVTDYDQVLSDPEAKKTIEYQAAKVGEIHKKAILAKLSKGEI